MLSENLEKVLVLEDDVDFEPDFRDGLAKLVSEAETNVPAWDLM